LKNNNDKHRNIKNELMIYLRNNWSGIILAAIFIVWIIIAFLPLSNK